MLSTLLCCLVLLSTAAKSTFQDISLVFAGNVLRDSEDWSHSVIFDCGEAAVTIIGWVNGRATEGDLGVLMRPALVS